MQLKFLGLIKIALGVILLSPAGVSARESIELADGADWTHPHSGIVVPAKLGGYARSGATAFAKDDLDVALQFDSEDGVDALTFYVFRNTNGGVPVWFEQARWNIEDRDLFGNVSLNQPPASFTPVNQTYASGLRAIYSADEDSPFRSTGIVLFSVDGWYVKVRASSRTRSAEELSLWIDQVLSEVSLPQSTALAAELVQDCSEPLKFRRQSKDAPKDGAAALMSSVLGMMAAEKRANGELNVGNEAVQWCRDSTLGGAQIVYRANASKDSYLIAIGDNGNAVRVAPDTSAALLNPESSKKRDRYGITLITAVQNTNYVAQDRLPSPERVVSIINDNRRVSSTPTWGDEKSIGISSDEL